MKTRSLLVSFAAVGLLACGNTGSPNRDYGPLLQNLGEGVILPEHRAFVTQSNALVAATEALQANPSPDTLANAQSAWRAARGAYRLLDALHIGPGYDLGITERIDASPADALGIEGVVSGTGGVDTAAVGALGGQKKGFLGLEYLLFPSDASSPAPVLAADAGAARRLLLAQGMAGEIAASAQQLDSAWEPKPTGGGYVTEIELAGKGGAIYPTQRAAVDNLFGGCWYALELVVGVRLAQPLGLHNGGTPDPSLDPTGRSDNAVADITATLGGFAALYTGSGFASITASNPALDQKISADLSDAQSKCAAIPAPFSSALAGDAAPVRAAYDSAKELKTTWNTDAASALGATAKVGENDGD